MTAAPTAGLTLDQLAARGAGAGSDLIPALPSGGQTLLKQTLDGLAAYVLTSVKQFGAVGDGVADDTSAIQAAINSGLPIWFPPGIYKTSATLTVQSYANCGQVLRGSGSYYSATSVGFSSTPPPGTSVIRPSSALSGDEVFIIDGAPIGGAGQTWVQGIGLENLCIDMVNMADEPSSIAIQQIQAWDVTYRHVRVINDGAAKRGWQFLTGAYVTKLDTCQANFVEAIGTSTGNGVTTLTFSNFDGNNLSTIYTNLVRVTGGSWQGTGTRFKFRYGCAFWLETDVEGSGTFLDVDSSVNGLWSMCELQGFSGTYQNGTPAPSTVQFDQQTNYNTYPFSMGVGGFKLNNQGNAGFSSWRSGATGADYYLTLGRTANEVLIGVAAGANDFCAGSVAGDAIVGSWIATTGTLFLCGAQVPNAKVNAAGFHTTGTGVLHQGQIIIVPGSDGADKFVIQNAAGAGILDVTTSNTGSSCSAAWANGVQLIGYTDAFSTQSWKILSASGQAQFRLLTVQPATDTTALQVNNAAGSAAFAVTTNATVASSVVYTPGTMQAVAYQQGVTQVVGARQTGWTAPTGTLSRGTFDQSTVTLAQLAQRLAALITDLTTHGLIGT